MLACRALCWRLGTLVYIAAIGAVPFDNLLFLEDLAIHYVLDELSVPRFVELFDFGYLVEGIGDVREALLGCYFGEVGVDSRPFHLLTSRRGFEIRFRIL